jgi:hypothetical protein
MRLAHFDGQTLAINSIWCLFGLAAFYLLLPDLPLSKPQERVNESRLVSLHLTDCSASQRAICSGLPLSYSACAAAACA